MSSSVRRPSMSAVLRETRVRGQNAMLSLVERTGIGQRAYFPAYRWAFSPAQLWAICQAAEYGASLDGAFVEVGVSRGETTVFLHKHLESLGIDPDYYCVDTFDGFTPEDVAVERERGRTEGYESWFRHTSPSAFERGLKMHGYSPTVIQADAATFDYSTLPPIAFAFVDLDVYRPMAAALAGCWERLVPGGIMVADDCLAGSNMWEGARLAYEEFCERLGVTPDVRNEQLGHVMKPLESDSLSATRTPAVAD